MPLAPVIIASIIGGGASLAGGALANKESRTSTPTMDPKYAGLQDLVLQSVQKRLSTPIDTAGYTGSGIANINRTYDLTKQSADNNLTARGLGTSPVAGAVDAAHETARGGAVATFQNSIPLLVDQMQRERLSDASNVLGIGRGVTTTGTSGGGAAGAFTNLAQYMGYLTGKGAFKGGSTGSMGLPGQQAMPGALGSAGAY